MDARPTRFASAAIYSQPAMFCLVLVLAAIAGISANPCIFSNGNYHLTYGVRGNTAHFRLSITGVQAGSNGWTGIGFGQSMGSGIDVIVVRLINGRIIVTDEYVQGYTSPFPDRINNVLVHATTLNNGLMVASFSRTIRSNEFPYDRTLQGCQPWQFIGGLNRMSRQGSLFHHVRTPVTRVVCIDQCKV